jgi:hypothetical protein
MKISIEKWAQMPEITMLKPKSDPYRVGQVIPTARSTLALPPNAAAGVSMHYALQLSRFSIPLPSKVRYARTAMNFFRNHPLIPSRQRTVFHFLLGFWCITVSTL